VRIPKGLHAWALRSADSTGLSWGRFESGVRGNYQRKPKKGGTAGIAAEYHNLCYQISTVLVKENLEVIEGEEDRTGTADR
jgi:hypothetical protein